MELALPPEPTSTGLAKKSNKRVAFIIGNGFNFLIQSLINAIPDEHVPSHLTISKEQVAESIGEITTLWKKFDELLSDLRSAYSQVNDEELIRMIYTIIDFFRVLKLLKRF